MPAMAGSDISVEPVSSLIDDKVRILVSGLEPKRSITLEARLVGDKGEVFQSHAHYIADKDGEVDVCRDSSLGGSYSGVSSMGLLWSMKPAPGQRKGIRLMKRDVTKSYNIQLKCFDDHISPHESSLQPLSSVTFQKGYMTDGVKRIVLKGERFRGTLFIPPGDGPFPGILDIPGGVAGAKEFKPALLASRGFVTLALSYMKPDSSGVFPPYFELEYFEEVLEWLSKHPKVSPGGVGVHAICFGTWFALLLASFRSDVIKAVVAISPMTFAFLSSFKYRNKVSEMFLVERSKLILTEDGIVLRYALSTVSQDNTTSDSKYSAITPCQNISCPVLLIYGTGDLNVNSDFCAGQVYERMAKNGKGHMCSILRYPGAGHLIEPPYSPHYYSLYDQNMGVKGDPPYSVFGGEIEAHAQAQEDAWPKIIAFLRRNVPQVKCSL